MKRKKSNDGVSAVGGRRCNDGVSARCCSSRFKPLSFVSKRDKITNVMVLYATHATQRRDAVATANGGTPSLQPTAAGTLILLTLVLATAMPVG